MTDAHQSIWQSWGSPCSAQIRCCEQSIWAHASKPLHSVHVNFAAGLPCEVGGAIQWVKAPQVVGRGVPRDSTLLPEHGMAWKSFVNDLQFNNVLLMFCSELSFQKGVVVDGMSVSLSEICVEASQL